MLRKLLIAAYLLAGLGLAGLWLRSYWLVDSVCLSWAPRRLARLTSSSGRLVVQIETDAPTPQTFEYWHGALEKHPWPNEQWLLSHPQLRRHPQQWNQPYGWLIVGPEAQWESGLLGVEYERGYAWTLIIAPHALPLAALVLAGPPAWWAMRVVRRFRRRRRGQCAACGYDLRGSGGACPECGHGGKPAGGSRGTTGATGGGGG